MQLREIMTLDVEVVDSKAVLKEAAAKMKHLDVGVMPVCDGEKLKGMLTDRDITVRATAEGRNPSKTKVSKSCPLIWRIASRTRKLKRPSASWK